MTQINQYNFFLNSKYRDSSDNATPIFNLGSPITLSQSNNYFTCKVLSVEIPYSFKSLASPNNKLSVRFVVVQDSINYLTEITVPEGNYNIVDLLDTLSTLLTQVMVTSGFNQVPTLDFTYSRETGRCTLNIIRAGGTHDVALTLYWTSADILAPYFGFTYENNTVLSYNTSNVVTSTNYISPNNVNVSPITSVYIRSSTLNQTAYNSEILVEQVITTSDILLRVPVTSYYNTWLIYENDSFEVKLNNKSIDSIELYVTSQTYDPIIFQGVAWKITLQINEYRPDIDYQTINNFQVVQELINQKNELVKELEDIKNELAAKISN
jgi:hypothetical protein